MPQETAIGDGLGPNQAGIRPYIEPSIRNALPHYLPLGIFPLILVAALYGGWWLLPAFLFMSVAGPLDRALGVDGRNMDPRNTPERRLLWHNLPVWTWAFLWPPTLIFGLWQILVANRFAIWEDVLLAIILTMEAQAVFVVGHELIHRRSAWERRLGEFLLASASYPQYATEHVYIHHAQVGTPNDVGSAPKGESFWRYFPKEVASNLTNSWEAVRQRLARRRLPRWHYSNPFWRYGLAVAFWYGLVFWMSGILAVLVFAFLGLSCVFSMKISNYFQHYGLRRVRLPNGRWEKVMPRHSWSADWKFSNWMFFNMQRHADHHAVASRHYPLLQVRGADESPELPGTYADMMNIVLRPKRWFEKMDPLVDQWRRHFYPEIDDWSAYDSPISAARPDAFEAIVEIFGAAPRLAKSIERNPELLDNLQDREFTDLDLPKGFGPNQEYETIARRGLTRLYWTHEMGVREMKDLIAELPTADARESSEIVRNWSNDKAFQVGMHVVRGKPVAARGKDRAVQSCRSVDFDRACRRGGGCCRQGRSLARGWGGCHIPGRSCEPGSVSGSGDRCAVRSRRPPGWRERSSVPAFPASPDRPGKGQSLVLPHRARLEFPSRAVAFGTGRSLRESCFRRDSRPQQGPLRVRVRGFRNRPPLRRSAAPGLGRMRRQRVSDRPFAPAVGRSLRAGRVHVPPYARRTGGCRAGREIPAVDEQRSRSRRSGSDRRSDV